MPLFPLALVLAILALLASVVGGLVLGRQRDARQTDAAWSHLELAHRLLPPRYDPAMVRMLAEPARRYFAFAIQPGTELTTVVRIRMRGELGLGDLDRPRYQPMLAQQVLAAPQGLVWRVRVGRGLAMMQGSDGIEGDRSWVRFRLWGLLPVVRAGGDADHWRAAFGRVVAEAAIWTPAALLPQLGVEWSAPDEDTARATVTLRGVRQSVDIRVDREGRPLWVRIDRWSDANPQKSYRLQPFGGRLADFRRVDGYRLPFDVEGGNFFQTPQYFAFYRAQVERIEPVWRPAVVAEYPPAGIPKTSAS